MSKKKKKKKITLPQIIINIIFILVSLFCIMPLILVLSVSFSSEHAIITNGYSFLPQEFTLNAYKYILTGSKTLIKAYMVTIFVTAIGTVCHVFITAMFSYTLSRQELKYRKVISFLVFFTLLFSGGLVPTYILISRYLHLQNHIGVFILPYLTNAIHVLIMRNFFRAIPNSIIESARIDGSGEFRTFLKIVLPISLPSLATIGLFIAVFLWNDWFTPLLYIENPNLYNLQFLLRSIMTNISYLIGNIEKFRGQEEIFTNLPNDTAMMATCIMAIGPIIILYPFLQKYFIKGLTLGSVKS